MNTKKSKVRLWSVLTALTAILTIAAIVGNMIANQYATTLNVALNASTYKIIKGNTTEDTEYFKAGWWLPLCRFHALPSYRKGGKHHPYRQCLHRCTISHSSAETMAWALPPNP